MIENKSLSQNKKIELKILGSSQKFIIIKHILFNIAYALFFNYLFSVLLLLLLLKEFLLLEI